MSSESHEGGSLAYRQNLTEAIDDMHKARRYYRQARSQTGNVPDHIHRMFEDAVLEVYDELLPFTIENEEIEQLWDEANMDQFPQQCARVYENNQAQTAGGRVRADTQIEIDRAPPALLFRVAQTFDMMATKLGLNVDTSRARKRGGITPVDQ